MDTELFWNRVKTLIKAHNIDQIKFTAHIGIPINTFRGWIHYNRVPDLWTSCAIAKSLGVSLDYLAYGEGNDNIEDEKKRRSAVKEAVSRMQTDVEMLRGYF